MSRQPAGIAAKIIVMFINKSGALKGTLEFSGDKSISHRAAMLAAMAEGQSHISNFATSEDCSSTLNCLRSLGVKIERNGNDLVITGLGNKGFSQPKDPLYCGNSGTTMRLMAGILAGMGLEAELTGDASLSKRPMGRIVGPLETMGAEIATVNGIPPIKIMPGRRLKGIDHVLTVPSAQVKSCILLAGLNAEGVTTVIEPVATRDHTERMLARFGVDVRITESSLGRRISVKGNSRLAATDIRIPGDISSAAFFMVAGACVQGSQISLCGVGLNPTRTAVIDVLKQAGIEMNVSIDSNDRSEPVGNMEVCGTSPTELSQKKLVLEGGTVANLIDELPIIAVLGTQLPAGILVRGAVELRVKETDRIAAVVSNLRRMGAQVEEFDDGFDVLPSRLKGARVESYGDHRIAMAFAVAGLFAEGETEITNAECVNVSFPGFFEALGSLAQH